MTNKPPDDFRKLQGNNLGISKRFEDSHVHVEAAGHDVSTEAGGRTRTPESGKLLQLPCLPLQKVQVATRSMTTCRLLFNNRVNPTTTVKFTNLQDHEGPSQDNKQRRASGQDRCSRKRLEVQIYYCQAFVRCSYSRDQSDRWTEQLAPLYERAAAYHTAKSTRPKHPRTILRFVELLSMRLTRFFFTHRLLSCPIDRALQNLQ